MSDDVTVDMEANEILSPIVTELFSNQNVISKCLKI